MRISKLSATFRLSECKASLLAICRTFRLSECRTSLLVLPSVRKVDGVNVRNEGNANAEKAIYRSSLIVGLYGFTIYSLTAFACFLMLMT